MQHDNKYYIQEKNQVEMGSHLNEKILEFPSVLPTLTISEHAEANRVLPPGTPRPGPLDLLYTPYLKEPMDNMSPFSAIQQATVMKGAQLGFTMGSECVLCYYTGYCPANQLYISSSEGNIEKWASQRYDPALDSYGYRDIIYSNDTRKGSRRSGDKTFSKEYFGMRTDMASAQSASSLRSMDKRILIRDEVDGAPAMLRTGEGNWMSVSYARTNSWGSRRKVLDFSTPTLEETSLIFKDYLKGDQRKFFVACPHCDTKQELLFKNLHPTIEKGILKDATYICEKCGVELYEYDKPRLLASGNWIATAISISPTVRSYQISSLYSPQGMMSWKELYQKYLDAVDDPDEMRSFVNLYLGKPFKEAGSRPKLQNIIENRGSYKSGEVQESVLFLTCAIDVQRGSEKDVKNPPRLEMEVLGHGLKFKTSSIEYRVFEGEVDDAYDGAWEALNQYVMETKFKYRRKDGIEFSPSIVFIDSGDGNFTDVVYSFCQRWANTFPIKGFSALKSGKKDRGDIQSINNFTRYKAKKVSEETTLYEISTNHYKTKIYRNLKIQRQEIDEQKAGFCDFPRDYGEKYFKMLTAEEKRRDGSFHNTSGKRNEALDCRVYALCAADVYLNSLVMRYRVAAKAKGADDTQLQTINQKYILKTMENQLNTQIAKIRR